MLFKMVCPQCGAQLDMDSEREFMFCKHCGTRVMNIAQRYDIQQNVQVNSTVGIRCDNSGQPNLIIQYNSTNPGVNMVVRFVSTNQKNYFITGQRFSYHMPFGYQNLVLKIGKKNYARTVYLPESNIPVSVYAGWNGRAYINIDQPPYTPPVQQTPQPVYRPVQAPSVYQPAQQPQSARLCPGCGQPAAAGMQFCTQCGKKLL